jgi:DMSO/TMAO reductase YedYZ molybdopterin-dependent catalytic subunit
MNSTIPRRFAAVAGLLAGGLAVTIGMFTAAVTEVVSPIDAVGSEVIDHTPLWLKEQAIEWFGTDDKLALRIGIISILALAAIGVGLLAARRIWWGIAGIALFGVVGAVAAAGRPAQSGGAAVPSILGALAGAALLYRLIQPQPDTTEVGTTATPGWDRRRFLLTGGVTAAGAVVAGGMARGLEDRRVEEIRQSIKAPLPDTVTDAAMQDIPPDAELYDETPYLTPNDEFYRIDTALTFPNVDIDSWSFDIKGMVDRPMKFTYADLLAMPQSEHVVTLCCVSNEVGGDLIGNAVFRGVMLRDLLDQVGVQSDAEQVYSTSLDGWTCGFPVDVAFDGRDAMVAIGMNGETLPLEHGYPARLVVPGLYGYVSATKWLAEIKLTTWDDEGYWVPRGWAALGPVKTESRIDVPRTRNVKVGKQAIAGVAWAQHRGIDKVEVQIDDGPWQEATLAADVSIDTWRQWLVEWDPTPGTYKLRVRATDKTGETQTEEEVDVAPDGATGYHSIRVTVE